MSKAVIGLGFGDEGKGVTVDFLTSQFKNSKSIVVRFSGGHQVGHTVVRGKKRHIFSNYGSGTMHGTPTYWSSNCTVDPLGLQNEYEILQSKGITPYLYISHECPIVTPDDKTKNHMNHFNNKHGTVGVGFGTTKEREENYYSLLAGDLLYPKVFEMKLEQILFKYYETSYTDIFEFKESCKWMLNCNSIKIVDKPVSLWNDALKIYEGSQGLLLDKNIGFFPHVTRDNTDLTNIGDTKINEVYFVTRGYQTRHGNGPMTNENLPSVINPDPNETNQNHAYQGEFRTSMLDLDLLKYSLSRFKGNYNYKTLVVTCLEHMKEFSYTMNGGTVFRFLDEISFINSIKLNLGFDVCLMCKEFKFTEV